MKLWNLLRVRAQPVFSGDGGLATSARINFPHDAAVAPDGSLFFADCLNSRVRKIDTDGLIHTVMTGLNYPIGVTVGLDGSVYVAEYYGHQIKRLRPDDVVEVFVGTGALVSAETVGLQLLPN